MYHREFLRFSGKKGIDPQKLYGKIGLAHIMPPENREVFLFSDIFYTDKNKRLSPPMIAFLIL